MNYEQKYNKLVNAIKVLQETNPSDEGIQNWVNDNVPELAESKDERIRKEFCKDIWDFIPNERAHKYIAWLEKQGELKSIWHNEDEEPKRGSLILLIMQSGTPIVAKIIKPNHTFNHGERWAYIDDLLEKQGEQKSAEWSEEDEEYINDLIGVFDGQQYQAHSDEEVVNWLKSIRLQYNKEWGKSDEEMLKSIIATCELACENRDSSPARHLLQMQTDWLKSLKQRIGG